MLKKRGITSWAGEEVLNAFKDDIFPVKDIDDGKKKDYEDLERTLLPQTSSPLKANQGNEIKDYQYFLHK